MQALTPRIGLFAAGEPDLADEIRTAGGEPVALALPEGRPEGGVVLAREWVADLAQISCSRQSLDALILAAGKPEDLAGLVLAAMRLNLPTVVAPGGDAYLTAALVALGLAPLAEDPARTAVEVARGAGPRPLELVEDFSLANALRVVFSLGGDPEVMVHLCAFAAEAGVVGFSRMLRVLLPETPPLSQPASAWFARHGVGGLLTHLGDSLTDTVTVTGRLREALPEKPEAPVSLPPGGGRLLFVEGRASGTEALCRAPASEKEVAGECRVHHSEKVAVRAVEGGLVEPGSLLVVCGCGPRGGPGLLRLDSLARVLDEADLTGTVPVITDGLPPRDSRGTWISLFSPEAAAGGVIGRLRTGDTLRMDLADGRIRTGVKAGEFEKRELYDFAEPARYGYAARYARSALSALEGAGFG